MYKRVSLLAIVALGFCAAALAVAMQTEIGSLSGTVKDPAGAVVAGAQVSLRNNATGETRNAS
ncbi:MAG TPA: carboxypeptidase-like regulatory domain-containing protein, partial [Blastocatellia bacterium]|nr:carboxypeptidase-like regulatory domain-containing protein [Blastocatellia bacterium]